MITSQDNAGSLCGWCEVELSFLFFFLNMADDSSAAEDEARAFVECVKRGELDDLIEFLESVASGAEPQPFDFNTQDFAGNTGVKRMFISLSLSLSFFSSLKAYDDDDSITLCGWCRTHRCRPCAAENTAGESECSKQIWRYTSPLC